MKAYAGIDLHSSNNYIGIMDQDHKRLFGRRLPNSLGKILMVLEPFKSDLQGVPIQLESGIFIFINVSLKL